MITKQVEMSIELVEKSILGTMLQENYLITDVHIEAEFFNSHVHRNIFNAMNELVRAGKSVDYISLLTTREPVELGGANYVADLKKYANAVKFDDYREILVDYWRDGKKRSILVQAQAEDWSLEDILKALDKLQDDETDVETSIRPKIAAMAERPWVQSQVKKGVTTGLTDLDKALNGFQKQELIIIAARPSMGKTDMMNHLVLQAGWAGYLPIVFSLEMSEATLLDRLLAVTGNYSRLKMRDPYSHFTAEQKDKWTSTIGMLDEADIHIDDRAGLKVGQIKAQARKIMKRNPHKQPIIFVDYLQIIRPDNPKADSTKQVGQISWDLKQMAKEFDCPVVCLSQLNRGTEDKQDKRPMLSNLRDSGNIEQDADVIAFLYREDYYHKDTDSKNILEIIVSKNRNGPTGTVKATYIKETGRIANFCLPNGGKAS